MNGGKNMLLFVDTDSIVYANMTDNYRGMSHTADDDIEIYFESATSGGNTGAYDTVLLSCTDEKQLEAMKGLAGALAGSASKPLTVIADDVNSVYCHPNVTAIESVTLATKGVAKNIIDWTADRTLLASENGSHVVASNVSEKHLQLPTVAAAGAGWFVDVQLKVIQSGNATAILAAAGEFFFGALRIQEAGTVTENTFIAVPTSTEDDVINLDLAIKGNLAGGMMRITCDGAAWHVDGDLVGSGTLHATNSIPFHTAES